MSDIGFYGIAAAFIFILLGIAAILLMLISGVSIWFFKNRRMKGFLQSGTLLFIFSILAVWMIEETDDLDFLEWVDSYSLMISFVFLGCCGWYGMRYFKRTKS